MNILVVHPRGSLRSLNVPSRALLQWSKPGIDTWRVAGISLCLGFPLTTGRGKTSHSATAESRNRALQDELLKHGITFEDLDRPPPDPLLYPALRCCKAFVCPPNQHAMKVADQPGRAAQVALDVARLLQDAQKAAAEWKDQRDRTRKVAKDFEALTPPLTLVMDCVRSTRNVGSLLRTCAVAGASVVFCGITPAPPMPAVLKSAGPAAALVPSSFAASGKDAVLQLQQLGFQAIKHSRAFSRTFLDLFVRLFQSSKSPEFFSSREIHGRSGLWRQLRRPRKWKAWNCLTHHWRWSWAMKATVCQQVL